MPRVLMYLAKNFPGWYMTNEIEDQSCSASNSIPYVPLLISDSLPILSIQHLSISRTTFCYHFESLHWTTYLEPRRGLLLISPVLEE